MHPKSEPLLTWAFAFFVLAVLAAFFGFGGLGALGQAPGKAFFFLFLGLAVTAVLVNAVRGRTLLR